MRLGVRGSSNANSIAIELQAANSSSQAQLFKLNQCKQSIPNGNYYLIALAPTKALDVTGQSKTNGTNLEIWTTNGGAAQRFNVTFNASTGYYTIKYPYGAQVLDVKNASITNGANVLTWPLTGDFNQSWSIDYSGQATILLDPFLGSPFYGSAYRVTAAHSGLVLGVEGNKNTDGAKVCTVTNTDGAMQPHQRWLFVSY
jgi:endo-alpha-N-acetylgalactosaminidase